MPCLRDDGCLNPILCGARSRCQVVADRDYAARFTRFAVSDYERVIKEMEATAGTPDREHPDNIIILSALLMAVRSLERAAFDAERRNFLKTE